MFKKDELYHLEILQLDKKIAIGFDTEEQLNNVSKILFDQVVKLISFSPKYNHSATTRHKKRTFRK